MGHRRLALLALAWLATAVAAGFASAWLLQARPPVVPGTAPQPPDSDPAPTADGPAPSSVRASRGGSPPAAEAEPLPAAQARPPAGPALGSASLEVQVLGLDGTPLKEAGVVYALGAGETGSDDVEDLCHVETSKSGETVLLRLPLPGRYDVGFAFDRSRALALDVEVPAGPPGRLELVLPDGHPLRVVGPPSGPLAGGDPTIWVHLNEVAGRVAVRFPGRGQGGRSSLGFRLGPDGSGESPPLPPGREYRVSAEFYETLPGLGGIGDPERNSSPRYRLSVEPSLARGGQTVRLIAEAAAVLLVHLRMEVPTVGAPAGKGNDALPLFVGFRQGEVERAWSTQVHRGDGGPPRMTLHFAGTDGPCEFRWSGNGIQGGSFADATLKRGEITERTLLLVPDPGGVEEVRPEPKTAEGVPPAPIPLVVTGLPPGTDRPLELCGPIPSEDGGEADDWTWDSEEVPAELEGILRTAPRVWAVSGTDFASEGTPVPAAGPLSIAMKPAGLLVAVPDRPIPEGLGRLLLRLSDRRPIFHRDEYASTDQEIAAGTLLGPFPEGTYVFEVRLGGLRLHDATATVRAGRIEFLRIRTSGP